MRGCVWNFLRGALLDAPMLVRNSLLQRLAMTKPDQREPSARACNNAGRMPTFSMSAYWMSARIGTGVSKAKVLSLCNHRSLDHAFSDLSACRL